jgi:hypothetical protein
MTPRWVFVSTFVVAMMMSVSCDRSGGVQRRVLPEGELISVKGKYTLILLSDEVMRRAFGTEWHRLSLFYGSNRAINERGERGMITSPLRPMGKGTSVLVISGDEWPDLVVPIYALETRKQALFYIDTVRPSIEVRAAQTRAGEPMVSPEGRLFFR